MRNYPRIIRERLYPQVKRNRNKRCSVPGCVEWAARRITLEVSWFRGEDRPGGFLCLRHGKKYRGANSVPNPDYWTDDMIVRGYHAAVQEARQ